MFTQRDKEFNSLLEEIQNRPNNLNDLEDQNFFHPPLKNKKHTLPQELFPHKKKDQEHLNYTTTTPSKNSYLPSKNPKLRSTISSSEYTNIIPNSSKNFQYLNKGGRLLTFQTKKKIIKETLVMELRQELRCCEDFNEKYNSYLNNVTELTGKVKKNKKDVESLCDSLKEEFREKFQVVDGFEKHIAKLKEIQEEIIKTNDGIIRMKQEEGTKLEKEFNNIQEKVFGQKKEILDIDEKIKVLENEKNGLVNVFQLKEQEQIDQIKILEKKVFELQKRNDYFQYEYEQYDKSGEDLVKVEVPLFDREKIETKIKEENLKINLTEQSIKNGKLLNDIDELRDKIQGLKDIEMKKKMKEMQYGKPLEMSSNKKNNNNKSIKNDFSKRGKSLRNKLNKLKYGFN